MKAYDSLDLAARNLRESVLRNALTTMGIAVGVASLVAMLSLGIGLQVMAGQRLTRSGLFDTIYIFQQREFGQQRRSNQRDQLQLANVPARRLDDTVRHDLEKLPNVMQVYPDIRFNGEVKLEGTSQFAGVASLPASSSDNDVFEKMTGKFFSSEQAPEVILHTDLAAALMGGADAPKAQRDQLAASVVGKDIILRYAERQPSTTPVPLRNATRNDAATRAAAEINAGDWGFSVAPRDLKLRVVGVVEHRPFSFAGGAGSNVMIPVKLAESLNILLPGDLRATVTGASERIYMNLVVRVNKPTQVERVENEAKKMGLGAFSLLDATCNWRRFFAILDLFLGIFGSLALAVASLGIINTLVMAILERRREIGIMKAIGASDGDVRGLFFAEAGAMGVMGGVFGVLLGWTIGRIINFGTNVYLQRQELPPEQLWYVPWWLVGSAIAFAMIVSLLAGLYPAARAAKLNPVEALRYE